MNQFKNNDQQTDNQQFKIENKQGQNEQNEQQQKQQAQPIEIVKISEEEEDELIIQTIFQQQKQSQQRQQDNSSNNVKSQLPNYILTKQNQVKLQEIELQENAVQVQQDQVETYTGRQQPVLEQSSSQYVTSNNSPIRRQEQLRADSSLSEPNIGLIQVNQVPVDLFLKKQQKTCRNFFKGSIYTIERENIKIQIDHIIEWKSVCLAGYQILIFKLEQLQSTWTVQYLNCHWKINKKGGEIVYKPPYFKITDFENNNRRLTYEFLKPQCCQNAKLRMNEEVVAEFNEFAKISIKENQDLTFLIPVLVFIDCQNLNF